MKYRTGLEIKKTILDQLAHRPYVLSELERRVGTNGHVLRRHLDELVMIGVVRLQQHPCHAHNGQRYTTAELIPILPRHSFVSIDQRKDDASKKRSVNAAGGSDARAPQSEELR